jgi:hemerythrin-like domain-containing protein
MATAIQELRHEHDIILRTVAVAERLGRRLATGQPVKRETLAAVVELFQTFADRCHHGKEERHLFPMLAARGVPVEGGPIGTMLEEHDLGRGLIKQMAGAADSEVAAAIDRYATLLRAHIDKENQVLFPLAEQTLDERDQRALAASFEEIERDVVGPGAHERLEQKLVELEAHA